MNWKVLKRIRVVCGVGAASQWPFSGSERVDMQKKKCLLCLLLLHIWLWANCIWREEDRREETAADARACGAEWKHLSRSSSPAWQMSRVLAAAVARSTAGSSARWIVVCSSVVAYYLIWIEKKYIFNKYLICLKGWLIESWITCADAGKSDRQSWNPEGLDESWSFV
jgi:hypothetical protein